MSYILITGADGFIGSALKKHLINNSFNVLDMDQKDGDIIDRKYFEQYIDYDINHVFHLAGKTFVPDSWEDPYSFYKTNVLGLENVLEFCRKKNTSMTFVSAYLYGQPARLPVCEDDIIIPNNPYAHSKYLGEEICRFYTREFNLKITIIRPFNIFGENQNVKFLIPEIIHKVFTDDVIKIKDLSPRRDYLYIEDLISALVLTIKSIGNFNVYNIGYGKSFSVKEIIDIILKLMNSDKPVISDNLIRKNEIPDVVADISRAKKEIGWSPSYTFEEGICKMLQFYKIKYWKG